jgi:flagellar biogenesis protein FliO
MHTNEMDSVYLMAYLLFVFAIIWYIIYLIREMINDKRRKF